MDAVAILEQATAIGLMLSVDNGRLNITGPKTAEAATLVQSMAPIKAELIAMLATDDTPQPEPYGDLTDWVGQTIDDGTWHGLQAECYRRYGSLWAFTAEQVADGWRVRRLVASAA